MSVLQQREITLQIEADTPEDVAALLAHLIAAIGCTEGIRAVWESGEEVILEDTPPLVDL